jgi:hypothetical protein
LLTWGRYAMSALRWCCRLWIWLKPMATEAASTKRIINRTAWITFTFFST